MDFLISLKENSPFLFFGGFFLFMGILITIFGYYLKRHFSELDKAFNDK
tara:strand:+ start:531 stop:677 length:147 start_codon:yes stop_codon:yes gene_type:complete